MNEIEQKQQAIDEVSELLEKHSDAPESLKALLNEYKLTLNKELGFLKRGFVLGLNGVGKNDK